jgi:hypothetical protein
MNNKMQTSFQVVSNKKKFCYLCKEIGHIQTDFTKNSKNEIIYICPLAKINKTKSNDKNNHYKNNGTSNTKSNNSPKSNKFEALFATTNDKTNKTKKEEFPELFVKPKDADEIIMPTITPKKTKEEKNIWKSVLLTQQPMQIIIENKETNNKKIVFIKDDTNTKDIKIPPKIMSNLQMKTETEKEYEEWTKTQFQKYLDDDPQRFNLYAKEFEYNKTKYDLMEEEYLDLSTEDDSSHCSDDSDYAIPY